MQDCHRARKETCFQVLGGNLGFMKRSSTTFFTQRKRLQTNCSKSLSRHRLHKYSLSLIKIKRSCNLPPEKPNENSSACVTLHTKTHKPVEQRAGKQFQLTQLRFGKVQGLLTYTCASEFSETSQVQIGSPMQTAPRAGRLHLFVFLVVVTQ